MKSISTAMVMAALTQYQSGLVLACLVFVTFLLIIGGIKMWKRLIDLEKVVYAGDRLAKKAQGLVDEIKSINEEGMT